MNNIDVNKKKLEEVNKKGKKFNLRKVLTVGLFSAGIVFAGTKAVTALNSNEGKEKVFEFEQDANNLDTSNDKEVVQSYLSQYKQSTNIDIADISKKTNTVVLSLANFDIAYDNYISSLDNPNKQYKIDSRVKLISATNTLVNTASEILSEQVKKASGYTDENTEAKVLRTGGGSAPVEDIAIINESSNRIVCNNIPSEMSRVLNSIEEIKIYSGDGTNDVWNNAIRSYSNKAIDLYNSILEVLNEQYTLNDDKLVNVNSRTR